VAHRPPRPWYHDVCELWGVSFSGLLGGGLPSKRFRDSGESARWGRKKRTWLRAASKVREELLGEEEGNGAHEQTRGGGRDGAECCANWALDEPASQRSDEHCEEGRHHSADRQDPTSALEVVGAAQRIGVQLQAVTTTAPRAAVTPHDITALRVSAH
jgi:hypothetical protein